MSLKPRKVIEVVILVKNKNIASTSMSKYKQKWDYVRIVVHDMITLVTNFSYNDSKKDAVFTDSVYSKNLTNKCLQNSYSFFHMK